MAEPAGLALGVVALAGLFDSCIQSFLHAVSSVDYGENCETLLAKLAAEKLSLQQWGDRVGILEDIEARGHPRLSDLTTSKTINEVLACVSLVLNNSKKLEEKYGLCSKQDADDGEALVEEATSQNSKVMIDYEKFERLVTLLQYFTQRLNDFCPIEPKPLERGEQDGMKNSSALDPNSSQETQIDKEATQEPHNEAGAPPILTVEEAMGHTPTIDKVSPAPVPDNLEAEILKKS